MFSRKVLPENLTPQRVFRVLHEARERCFWLDSGVTALEGKSYLGVSDEVVIARAGSERAFLTELREGLGDCQAEIDPDAPPLFQLGWVGWLSYEFGQALLGLHPHYREDTPPALMMRVRTVVEFDHRTGLLSVLSESDETLDEWMLEFGAKLGANVETNRRANVAVNPDAVAIRDESDSRHASKASELSANWREDSREYLDRIARCQAAIERGDAYILCLTSQLEVELAEHPADIYERLRTLNPAHHGGYIAAEGVTLLSASPEQFLSVTATGYAETKPIKGTRPRDADTTRDAALARELVNDEKERAENLMIVDLMRNDFSTVCEPASVRVRKLHAIESYEHVHQLVSTVAGQLASQYDALDLVASCFPAGSMTGTPKRSAVSLLRAIENAPRGLYSGCFGYFSQCGSADLAMVIRSLVITGKQASIGSGGGLTADSVPEAEIAEVELKAQALMAAIESENSPVM